MVCNLPGGGRLGKGATLLPMSGGVGAQYTPAVGWAQAIAFRRDEQGSSEWRGAMAVATGGDASASTNGFWAALNIATTLDLPMLFYMEDNGYGISVPAPLQTPGGDHVANLASWPSLKIVDGDGADPRVTPGLVREAVNHCREGKGAALLRLKVPRLCGHTFQDTQAYKPAELIEAENKRDPLPRLRTYLLEENILTEDTWAELEAEAEQAVREALAEAEARPQPNPQQLKRHVFAEKRLDGSPELSTIGGLAAGGHAFPESSDEPQPSGQRINMITAIRRTLDAELKSNPKLLVFGEDVGPKGGVHGATLGLADAHGDARVFDTSLSEEGIIGRSVGMAVAGLMPVPEIQFRKYAEPAAEQLTDAGTMRWRTANRFACPMVVRVPGGFARRGDPWHSMCDEVEWAHKVGWQVAMPSQAEDAVGLLRAALRGDNPTIFFEHRHLYDNAWSRRPYPGDDYLLPFGRAHQVVEGNRLTIVTWGAMVERCEAVAQLRAGAVEVLDLRTLVPWDRERTLESVKKTGRCLIVHEDNRTAGFGSEVAAVLADELFWELDAPLRRVTMPDIPNPHNLGLLETAVPSQDKIAAAVTALLAI
ncbi:MAG: thiamine pyrophosphate-dependent enzyme [Pseudomonadota bacterium]